MVPAIEKAIYKSDLGLTPNTAGAVIRIPHAGRSPRSAAATSPRSCAHEAENARVAVRNVRRDVHQRPEGNAEGKADLQDDERRAQDDDAEAHRPALGEIDQALAAKEKEILQV